MVKFNKIKIEGFGSIGGSIKYTLSRKGITVLSGENGAGKTTIFSALMWGLFGKGLKEKSSVVTWNDRQPSHYKGTKVSVYIIRGKDKYVICRHKKYKGDTLGAKGKDRLILMRNGEELTEYRDKKDIQSAIVSLIGCSYDLFKNSIVFGQRMKRIMQETGPAKKKVYEEAFEVTYLSQAKAKVEDSKKKILSRLVELEPEYEKIKERYKNIKAQYQQCLELSKNFDSSKKIQLSKLNKSCETVEKGINEIDKKLYKNRKGKPKIKELQGLITRMDGIIGECEEAGKVAFKLDLEILQLEGDVSDYTNEIKGASDFLSGPNPKCPVCESKLDLLKMKEMKTLAKDKRKKALKNRKDAKNTLIVKRKLFKVNSIAESSLKGYKIKRESLQTKLNKLESKLGSRKALLKDMKEKTDQLREIQDEITLTTKSKFEVDLPHMKSIMVRTKKKLKPFKKEYKAITKELRLVDWVIQDPLSNSGIKSFIFNEMLSLVNDRLKIYAQHLGWVIKFHMDMESANKNMEIKIYQGEFERDYDDLSGGEMQLVDICLAFATHDIISMERPCNILLMDEVFESLRGKNIDIVSELIRIKGQDRSVHLVTHLTQFAQTNAYIIEIQLDNDGLTTIQ